jgi:1-acyl-sn-glycerol-3-phosphate acyltransferase
MIYNHIMGYLFIRLLVHIVIRLVARIKVEGWDRVPKSGSFIVVSNHIGRLDALLAYYFLDRKDIIMIVAEKYRKSAFWRFFVKQVDGIFIDRYQADFSAIREVLKRLQKGGVLGMTPEGTRSKDGKLHEGRPGTAYLGAKTGVLMLPVGNDGSDDNELVRRLKRMRRLDIVLRVGEPFRLPPLVGRQREAQLDEYTEDIMCRIAALLPEWRRGYYADHPGVQKYLNQPAD